MTQSPSVFALISSLFILLVTMPIQVDLKVVNLETSSPISKAGSETFDVSTDSTATPEKVAKGNGTILTQLC